MRPGNGGGGNTQTLNIAINSLFLGTRPLRPVAATKTPFFRLAGYRLNEYEPRPA